MVGIVTKGDGKSLVMPMSFAFEPVSVTPWPEGLRQGRRRLSTTRKQRVSNHDASKTATNHSAEMKQHLVSGKLVSDSFAFI